jgi:hypothetical protein
MLNSKTKGLFIDISEFSILAARTSGYKLPMVIEEIAEFPITSDRDPDEIRDFFETLVDFKGAGYFVSRCGVYPDDRFVRYFESDNPGKLKDPNFLTEKLQSDFGINPDKSRISVLDARNGSDYDLEKGNGRRLIFCGASVDAFSEVQEGLLEMGIYPERLELSSVTTLGGVSDYARFTGTDSPVLFLELTSKSANIFILNRGQLEVARPVPFGLDSIYPLLQRELGLKDEDSARKLFFSNTFDFAEMGPKLLRKMTKELQASTGFYEVQTGQTIGHVFLSVLPSNLNWVGNTISDTLGVDILQPSVEGWLESLKIKIGDEVEVLNLGSRWMGLFSLMGEFHLREEVEE